MKTPGRIVVGVDGSPSSLDALKWAVGEAALTGAGVQAVIAWGYPPLSGVNPMTAHVNWRIKAKQTLEAAVEEAPGADSGRVSSVVIAGDPAQVLVQASVGAQLLVVGNSGHGGLTKMLPGSVREHVITHATCPVLVIRQDSQAPAGSSE